MRQVKVFCTALFGLLALGLNAQQFEVSPSKMMFAIEPGKSGTQQLKVTNKSDVKKSYILELRDWTVDEAGEISYVEENAKRTCTPWVNITPAFFDLGPNESVNVSINLNVPDSGVNTRWSMLMVREAVEQTSAVVADKALQSGIVISPNIAVYILQSPASNNSLKAGIRDLVDYPSVEGETTRRLSAQVTNAGDRILDCKVYLMIMDLNTAEETKVDPVTFLILPGVKKQVILDLPDGLKPGDYSIAAILDYGNDAELEGVQIDYTIPEQ